MARWLLPALALILATLSHSAAAAIASSSTSTSAAVATSVPSATDLQKIEQAQAEFPVCALKCLAADLPKSVCSVTDLQCQCTNVDLTNAVTLCTSGTCSLADQLTTKNVTETMCGGPVRNKTDLTKWIGVIGAVIAFVTFLLRMLACSPSMGRSMGYEEYAIAIAMALAIPPAVFAVYLANNGLGKDIWTLTIQQITNVLYYYFLGELFYVVSQAFIKASLLFFLMRVFRSRNFHIACWIIMTLTGLYGFIFFMVTLFQCWPIDHAWLQLQPTHSGHCRNENLQSWVSAALNIALDLAILVLPIQPLWQLQISPRSRLLALSMFCLGIFVTLVSILRLRSLISFSNSANTTWDGVAAAYWSLVEVDVGIITACLPAARVFVAHVGTKAFGSTLSKSQLSSGAQKGDSRSSKNRKSGPLNVQTTPLRGDEDEFIALVEVDRESAKTRGTEKDTIRTESQGTLTAWDSKQVPPKSI